MRGPCNVRAADLCQLRGDEYHAKRVNPVDLILAGDVFSTAPPHIALESGCRLIATQNIIFAKPVTYPDDVLPEGALTAIADALDDERELGAEDLRLSY